MEIIIIYVTNTWCGAAAAEATADRKAAKYAPTNTVVVFCCNNSGKPREPSTATEWNSCARWEVTLLKWSMITAKVLSYFNAYWC